MKISKLLLSFSLLFPLATSAAKLPEKRLICATPHLTTSYVLLEHEHHFELQVVHHHGVELMPVHDGLITIQDLETLLEWSKSYRKLGSRYSVFFEKSQCRINQKEWVCFHSTPTTLGELPVDAIGLRIFERRTIQRRYDQKTLHVDFTIVINRISYSLPMRYEERDCQSFL